VIGVTAELAATAPIGFVASRGDWQPVESPLDFSTGELGSPAGPASEQVLPLRHWLRLARGLGNYRANFLKAENNRPLLPRNAQIAPLRAA